MNESKMFFWCRKIWGLKKDLAKQIYLAKYKKINLNFVNCTQHILLIVLILIIQIKFGCAREIKNTNEFLRFKKQSYEDPYYNNYYGWQAGRLIGWILGFIVLMLFLCVPCVCCLGIWFAGWFGLRQAMVYRQRRPPTGAHLSSHNQIPPRAAVNERHAREIHVDPPSPVDRGVVYAQSSDRYFEQRQPSTQRSQNAYYIKETRRL